LRTSMEPLWRRASTQLPPFPLDLLDIIQSVSVFMGDPSL